MEESKSRKFLEENEDHEFNESLKHYLNICPERQEKVYRLLDNQMKIFEAFSISRKYSKTEKNNFFSIAFYYFHLISGTEHTYFQTLRDFSQKLKTMTSDRETLNRPAFILEEVREIAKFFIKKIFVNHTVYLKLLRTKKELYLSTFKLFKRKNPFDMPLNSGEEISDIFEIPFLRDALLEEGEFMFTKEEIERIVDEDRLGEYEGKKREYLEKEKIKLLQERKIKKILDKKIGEIKKEVDLKVKEVLPEF